MLNQDQIDRFRRDGFLHLPALLDAGTVERLRGRFEPLFKGEFETGIWPDEWHWREGMSLPDVTRHMANAWKSDRAIARHALSPRLGELAAELMDWPGTRLGQDTIWWKTPLAKEIALHQDCTYISYLDPAEMATCWVALDDTFADAGTIEYVPGSHRWPLVPDIGEFHAPDRDYRARMRDSARAAGIEPPEPVKLEVAAGDAIVHDGRTWHGSGPNRRADRMRRSIGLHMLSSETRFRPEGAGYIYGRYQRPGETRMEECFFPTLWRRDGFRSAELQHYLSRAGG
jgi:ectoine hydroxylase-related dioxygenase (phytanoyl-CoA dioxygenase family)